MPVGQEGYLDAEWSEALTTSVRIDMADRRLRHAVGATSFHPFTGCRSSYALALSGQTAAADLGNPDDKRYKGVTDGS